MKGFLTNQLATSLKKALLRCGLQGIPTEQDYASLLKLSRNKFCQGAQAYLYERDIELGLPDDISKPPHQCDPSCREICFNF
jgi:hypothetical protein